MAAPSDDIMTIEALAEYLKISRSTLYKAGPGRQVAGPEGWQALAVPQGSH